MPVAYPGTEIQSALSAAQAVLSQVETLIEARRSGLTTLDDWTGAHRRAFDDQFPTSQADLESLRESVRRRIAEINRVSGDIVLANLLEAFAEDD